MSGKQHEPLTVLGLPLHSILVTRDAPLIPLCGTAILVLVATTVLAMPASWHCNRVVPYGHQTIDQSDMCHDAWAWERSK